MDVQNVPDTTFPAAVRAWIQTLGWTEIDSYDYNAEVVELKGDFGDGWEHFATPTHCTMIVHSDKEERSERFDMRVEGWKIEHAE